jgi:hypothetical protein
VFLAFLGENNFIIFQICGNNTTSITKIAFIEGFGQNAKKKIFKMIRTQVAWQLVPQDVPKLLGVSAMATLAMYMFEHE